jgi:large subunit ribosomal protein L9
MKILLIKDVKKVGQRGEVVEVAEGYGRNFLIKGGLGKPAVGGALKDIKNKEKIKETSKKNNLESELKILGEKNKQKFTLKKNSDNGHLFAKISQKEISEVSGVPEKNIVLDEDIKSTGEFEIKVNLGGKKGKIFLIVE